LEPKQQNNNLPLNDNPMEHQKQHLSHFIASHPYLILEPKHPVNDRLTILLRIKQMENDRYVAGSHLAATKRSYFADNPEEVSKPSE